VVPTLVVTDNTEVYAGGADCSDVFDTEKGHYDDNYRPECDFVNEDAKAGDSVPKCDGSYQDCYTEDGFFCEAGSGEHFCEVEDEDEGDNGDSGSSNTNNDDDNGETEEGSATNEDNLFGN
jgi:hypothetical protein